MRVSCSSLKTLYSPDAAKGYQEHGRRRGWGDDRSEKRSGGGGGPRISGMNNLGGGGSGAPIVHHSSGMHGMLLRHSSCRPQW